MFKLKLKTKNGNDIKEKVIFNCYFTVDFKNNPLKASSKYNYKIMIGNVIIDSKDKMEIKSICKCREELVLRVIGNLNFIIDKICTEKGLKPDFIMYFSEELGKNRSKSRAYAHYLYAQQDFRESKERPISTEIRDSLKDFSKKYSIPTKMFVSPRSNSEKYKKSIFVLESLEQRLKKP